MNQTQVVISAAFLIFSVALLLLSTVLFAKKALLRKYVRSATLLYMTGTIFIFLIYLLRQDLPLKWTLFSEILVFAVYGGTLANILYIVKRFEKTSAKIVDEKDIHNEVVDTVDESDDIKGV